MNPLGVLRITTPVLCPRAGNAADQQRPLAPAEALERLKVLVRQQALLLHVLSVPFPARILRSYAPGAQSEDAN